MTKPPKGTFNIPAVYVVLREEGKILFTFREHTGFADGTYSLPSGHVEEGENALAAAVREVKEEVGVTINPKNLTLIYTMHRMAENDIRIDFFFETNEWEGEPFNNEPHKHGDIEWFTPEELAEKPIMDYQAAVMQAILGGKMYSEWGWPE